MGPGEHLRAWLSEHGVTVYRIAADLQCSTTAVHHWMSGRRRPSEARRRRIADRAGIPAESWPAVPVDAARVASRREACRSRYALRRDASVCVDCEEPVTDRAYCRECIAHREAMRGAA